MHVLFQLTSAILLKACPLISIPPSVPFVILVITTAAADDHADVAAVEFVAGRSGHLRAGRGGAAMGLTPSAAAAAPGGRGGGEGVVSGSITCIEAVTTHSNPVDPRPSPSLGPINVTLPPPSLPVLAHCPTMKLHDVPLTVSVMSRRVRYRRLFQHATNSESEVIQIGPADVSLPQASPSPISRVVKSPLAPVPTVIIVTVIPGTATAGGAVILRGMGLHWGVPKGRVLHRSGGNPRGHAQEGSGNVVGASVARGTATVRVSAHRKRTKIPLRVGASRGVPRARSVEPAWPSVQPDSPRRRQRTAGGEAGARLRVSSATYTADVAQQPNAKWRTDEAAPSSDAGAPMLWNRPRLTRASGSGYGGEAAAVGIRRQQAGVAMTVRPSLANGGGDNGSGRCGGDQRQGSQ